MQKQLFGVLALAALVACVGIPADAFASNWSDKNPALEKAHADRAAAMISPYLGYVNHVEPLSGQQTVTNCGSDCSDRSSDEDESYTVSGLTAAQHAANYHNWATAQVSADHTINKYIIVGTGFVLHPQYTP